METDLRAVSPGEPAEFRAWYETFRTASLAGRENAPFFGFDEATAMFGRAGSAETGEAIGAFAGDACLGAADLRPPMRDNLRLARTQIAVLPEHRGRGVGTALMSRIVERARAEGRSSLLAHVCVPAGAESAPGERFAREHGFTLRNTEIRRVLDVPLPAELEARLEASAAERTGGYRMLSWIGACPEEYVAQYATFQELIAAEAPSGSLSVEVTRWDAVRQREDEQRRAARGRTTYVTVAVAPDGDLAGFTRIFSTTALPAQVQQSGTLVVQGHRGRRLGLAMKLANLREVLAAEPQVRQVETLNAEQNAPMVAVNVQLGFAVVERVERWQGELTDE